MAELVRRSDECILGVFDFHIKSSLICYCEYLEVLVPPKFNIIFLNGKLEMQEVLK